MCVTGSPDSSEGSIGTEVSLKLRECLLIVPLRLLLM